ncbi:hypothetical protein XM38_033260 [Halomicronema hongdechloris C2206]|uniref:Uncharacterized protein n=1 Tax=Halomicronema hongdechloris C2206 TaxID=1641165 RepID=A0A1Z3HPZ7_9CYAN|nr:hypothetical protein XM38_033260 [Halomicronema hongdechloris C2206]
MVRGDQIYVMRQLAGLPGVYEHHGIDCDDAHRRQGAGEVGEWGSGGVGEWRVKGEGWRVEGQGQQVAWVVLLRRILGKKIP